MPSIDLTIGEGDFGIEFEEINETTGGAFDLTGFNNVRLFISTTDFVTSIVPGGIILTLAGLPEEGLLEWDVNSSHVPTSPGQFYGQIVFENTTTNEIRKGRQMDFRALRALPT